MTSIGAPIRRGAAGLALAFTVVLTGGCVTDRPPRERAVEKYREGEKLFEKGDLIGCRDVLNEGFDIAPDYAQLRRDLGMVNFELGKEPMFRALGHADASDRGRNIIQRFDRNNDGRASRDEVSFDDLAFDVDGDQRVNSEERSWAESVFGTCDFNGDGAIGQDDVAAHKSESDRFRDQVTPFFREAKRHYDYAIQHRPHEPMPYYNMARIHAFEGNLRAAREMLQQAINIGNPAGDKRREMEDVLAQLERQIADRAVGGTTGSKRP